MGATGPRESESRVQGVDVGVRGSVTGTEVRQAEGWACEGSHAVTVPGVPLNFPRAGQSPASLEAGPRCPSPPALCSSQSRGGVFPFCW